MKGILRLINDFKEWVLGFFWEYYPDSTYAFKSKNFMLLLLIIIITYLIYKT